MGIPHEEGKPKEAQDKAQGGQDQLKANKRPLVWDCESTLYDSFELKSFERQLSSAINSRTLSMPHLPDRRLSLDHVAPPPPPPQTDHYHKPPNNNKKPSRISRSLHRLLKSMFKPRQDWFRSGGFQERHVVYDKSGALTTIPEAPPEVEFGGFSPDIGPVVGRTASERFPASLTISCP